MRIPKRFFGRKSIVLFLLIISGIVLLTFMMPAKKTPMLMLQFPKATLAVGETILAPIIIKQGTKQVIDVAMLDLSYDPGKVELISCTVGETFEGIHVEKDPCTKDKSKPGIVRIDVESVDDGVPMETVTLAYLTFRGKKPGTLAFAFAKSDVVANHNDTPLELQLTPEIKPQLVIQ